MRAPGLLPRIRCIPRSCRPGCFWYRWKIRSFSYPNSISFMVKRLSMCRFVLQESPNDRFSGGRSPSVTEHVPSPPTVPAAPSDWVIKERLGKKGEFRYFWIVCAQGEPLFCLFCPLFDGPRVIVFLQLKILFGLFSLVRSWRNTRIHIQIWRTDNSCRVTVIWNRLVYCAFE